MRGIGGLISLVVGVMILLLSIFWPDNTHLALLLLTFGALACSWEGVETAQSESAAFWTGVGVVITVAIAPFFVVFGAPASPLFTVSTGIMIAGIAILADRYVGGKWQATMGSRENWPLLAAILLVGGVMALLIRSLQ